MKPTVGLTLGGRYRLQRRIAVGGMGEVWVAHDTSLARDVAVKVLREEYAGQEDFLERLRTEARNSAGLSHTNIAQLYDYGEQGGSGYLVMELIMGEPMSDLLEREPVLPPRRLLPILSQTARGLHAAHVGGVVHRDIKPGNILLEHGSIVKITDFGVSLAANQVPMTATGMVMGTAQYLSPEQAIGKPATGASDIYALGIVAYESLVGHRPFTGPTAVDIAVAHVNEEVPPLPDKVHADLAALVMQMLAKDPVERPRSGASLASMLDEIAESIAEDPYGRLRTGRRSVSPVSPRTPDSVPSPASTPSPAVPVGRPPAPPSSDHPQGRPVSQAQRFTPVGGGSVPSRPPAPPAGASAMATRSSTRAANRTSGARSDRAARTGSHAGNRTGSQRSAARRAAQPTGIRMGRLSWPLLGLLILMGLLLIAAIIRGFGPDPGGDRTPDSALTRVGSVVATPTTPKDE